MSSSDRDIQGVDISNPESKGWKPGYEESDVRDLWRHANASSWPQLLRYVENKGDNTWHITPGEAIAMKEDIEATMKSGASFPNSPEQAYQEMHSHRGQDRGKEPKAEKERQSH
ncbi:MAG TPA: hypothetical protein VF116_17645 [Ktedonobacterales bacterium]